MKSALDAAQALLAMMPSKVALPVCCAIWPELMIDDYDELTAQTIEAWKSMNGQQGGDPKKLGQALVTLSDSDELPKRFIAGADGMAGEEQNLAIIQAQINAHRQLSASLSYDA